MRKRHQCVKGLMSEKSFQDYYPDDTSHCYGCGTLNPHGYHIQSFWVGDEAVCRYEPKEFHTAIPGYVYGGLVAALIDCHSTGAAAAAAYRADGRELGTEPPFRFVTGSLHVDYLKPTPIGVQLEVWAVPTEIKERKIVVESTLFGGPRGEAMVCAKGKVVAVRMPEQWVK